MSEHLAWYVARSAGLVAWGLVTVTVVWGLLLSTRLLDRRPRPAWLLDLHRWLGGLSVTFTAVHVGALVADSTVAFGWSDVLVPFATSWHPAGVALGVVGAWLLAAVELTSLAMRRLPRRLWRWVHLGSHGLFWLTTAHLVTVGSDAASPVVVAGAEVLAAVVVFLTLVAALAPTRSRRSASAVQRPERVVHEERRPDQALEHADQVLPEAVRLVPEPHLGADEAEAEDRVPCRAGPPAPITISHVVSLLAGAVDQPTNTKLPPHAP